jgi:uncharacterized protein
MTAESEIDPATMVQLEAAAFRRLVEHLRTRSDVQNIEMMNLTGFCRNCLSNWMMDAASASNIPMSKDASRQIIYGMPYAQWQALNQQEATPEQIAAFAKANEAH